MPEEFKPIETQEAFDAAIKSRLERNTRTVTEEVTKKYEGYLSPDEVATAKEKQAGKITELQEEIAGYKATISDLQAENKKHVNSTVKLRIAHEVGIPYELAEKISGETEEEIRADAENLAKYTSARRQPTPKFSSESPERQDTQKLAYREMLQSLNQK